MPLKIDDLFAPDTSNPKTTAQTGVPRCNDQEIIAAAVSSKLEDGNIKAAIRILCSEDKPVPINLDSLNELNSKHPSQPLDRPITPIETSVTPFQTSEEEVRKHIHSFPAGSSGGPDGLRPQHLLDLTNCKETGPELISAITALVNLLLAGTCPNEVRSTLFGGTLFALRKKSGGLRPIVIGYFWRRLSSKCANTFALPRVSTYFAHKQVGVGVPGGCEAAVHTVRRFLSSMQEGSVVVKLDFSNAFNSLYRDRMLSSVSDTLPELLPYCNLAYAETSDLKFGRFSLRSEVGPQQGDPLGPLLFCLPLQVTLLNLQSPLVLGYLDDLTLGGAAAGVAADVETIERECREMGLSLNHAKC